MKLARAAGAGACWIAAWLGWPAGLPAQETTAPPGVSGADPVPSHETLRLDSRTLGEWRTINIHTPPGYDAEPGRAFPVVYMPDGGLGEDFPHVVNTLDSLAALGRIRPVIVVGIENTERRRDLTGPTTVPGDSAIAPRVGGSAAFRDFIRDELMPVVRARLRCADEATLVGESLAGLFVVETFLLEPALFDRYIALSPSLWWDGGALVRSAGRRLAASSGEVRSVYLAAAGEPGIAEGTATLARLLAGQAPAGLDWYYEPRPDLEHATIFRALLPGAFARVLR